MTGHVKVSGAFKTLVSGTAVKVGGAWKDVTNGYVKVSGAWKEFFASGVVTVSGESIVSAPPSGGAQAKLFINADGTIDKEEEGVRSQIDSLTDWIIPNSAASSVYEVRYTGFSGDSVGSSLTEDAWEFIDVDHFITLTRVGSNPGTSFCSFTIEIRLDGGAVLDSATYDLTSTVA